MSDEYTETLRLYKDITWGSEISLVDQGVESNGYVAVSHPLEVTFAPLNKGDVVNSEIAVSKSGIKEVNGKAAETVRKMEDKIQTLLALPNLTGK